MGERYMFNGSLHPEGGGTPEAGYGALARAIISLAVDDYTAGLLKPSLRNRKEVSSAKSFLDSEWCYQLSNGIDPSVYYRAAEQRAKHISWRREHNCMECKRDCPHRRIKAWDEKWNGAMVCPKEKKGEVAS